MQDPVKLTVRVVFTRMGLHSLTYLNIWSFVGGIRRCALVGVGVSTMNKLWCFNRFVPFAVYESLCLLLVDQDVSCQMLLLTCLCSTIKDSETVRPFLQTTYLSDGKEYPAHLKKNHVVRVPHMVSSLLPCITSRTNGRWELACGFPRTSRGHHFDLDHPFS